MITTGLTLAAITGLGFWLVFKKLPKKVRTFMKKHALFTDAVSCLLTYLLFGRSLVALFAAAWLGLIVSVMLSILNNPGAEALIERFAMKCGELKNNFMTLIERIAPVSVTEEQPQLHVGGE